MGNAFGSEKPLKEIVRENQRMIKKAVRELDREISDLSKNEKKLIADIKKMAEKNQIVSCVLNFLINYYFNGMCTTTAMQNTVKIMAKDLVRTRNYIARFIEMKTQLNAVGLKIQAIKSHEAMSSAMKVKALWLESDVGVLFGYSLFILL